MPRVGFNVRVNPVFVERLVQIQLARARQLQRHHRDDRLGQRSDVENRVGRRPFARFELAVNFYFRELPVTDNAEPEDGNFVVDQQFSNLVVRQTAGSPNALLRACKTTGKQRYEKNKKNTRGSKFGLVCHTGFNNKKTRRQPALLTNERRDFYY